MPYHSFSQTRQGSIKGRIIEKQSGLAAICASVVVLDSLDGQIAGGVSDVDGFFNINPVKVGSFTVEIRSIGFETKRLEHVATFSNLATILDTVNLIPSNHLLSCAVVIYVSTPVHYETYCYASSCVSHCGWTHHQDEPNTSSVEVYPNPTQGKADAVLKGSFTSLGLFNLNGELLKTLKTNEAQVSLDLSCYPPGTYLLKGVNANENISEKIVLLK